MQAPDNKDKATKRVKEPLSPVDRDYAIRHAKAKRFVAEFDDLVRENLKEFLKELGVNDAEEEMQDIMRELNS